MCLMLHGHAELEYVPAENHTKVWGRFSFVYSYKKGPMYSHFHWWNRRLFRVTYCRIKDRKFNGCWSLRVRTP